MTEITEVPSPFCGIGTDDLSIQVDGATLKVIANGCAVNTPAFEQAIADTTPRVAGQSVSLEAATSRAAELLRGTNQPLIGGCATDVNGMRALLALADKSGAVVDNLNFNNARRNLLALQDSGWINTTLAELKNRCDLLLVVGTDLEAFAPRFFEKYLWNEESMFLDSTANREIIYLGKAPSGNASTAPTGQKATVLPCADADLPDVAAVLSALVKGHILHAQNIAGIAINDLQAVADKLKAAHYGVVLWGAAALAFDQAELTVQTLCSIVKDLNQLGTRCSGFPLGGKEGDQTANQVCGWTTGYPARVNFARGYPEYDPYLYDTQTLLNNGEADALVWVQAFNSGALPPKTDLPTIVIGRSGIKFEKEPDVFIPVGTPGIDHSGHAYRLDNVVAIRLKKLRDSGLPSTAEVLTAIEQAL
ncbi:MULTISPECIES: formylmethanofuran dehydrogenase subunit B [Methylomonas]|uniref:Formylmethanofuran dehydrogenase subunit B n=2 Tax=Methylomonas TaxID=416 RepID=A0A126T5Y1_9GAMM|nr:MULTISPECIES: formylmethanofuran dehydrogenase subunit B [Methylomonas]AMK77485.1 formylmethanofuran dehydrogenase subunit B [Methylomonas denitrificans]OAI05069.1 formylmethanofuran dehydrogenase subunit B [Methylomonas methanica]TCV84475.1 formylmethanofuran dehydrogenase subunit B [Methylomonas methanica]